MGIGAQIKNWGGAVLKDAKHALRDEPVRHWLNSKLGRYGEMLKLEIDSKQKTVELEILLVGEDKPVQVTILKYEIIEGGLSWSDVKTSRQWITEVIKTFAPNPVPISNHKALSFLKTLHVV
jgi:hypothetical protein